MDWFINLSKILQSFIGGTFTFSITTLGCFLTLFIPKLNEKILSLILGFSGGVMIASSFYSLLTPAIEIANTLNHPFIYSIFIGIILGFIFIVLIESSIKNKTNSKMLLTSMTIHNIPEGLCIGVAFGSVGINNVSLLSAIYLTFAIGLQNFPEGAAVSFPLQKDGYSKSKSIILGSLTAIVEPVSAFVGCILVIIIKSLLPYLLSFAAIIMILVVINELLPEIILQRKISTNLGFILGFLIMLLLDVCLN